jgi:glycosyltransferase involved in cell wall biosynthesis
MRILIVHNTLNDSRSVSGVLRHYAWMANEWIAAGHPTDFLVARAGFPQLAELAPHSRRISSDNWFNATHYIAQTWRYFPAYFLRMASAHWARIPRYDLIYASTQLIVEVYAARVLARRQNAAFVAKIHHVLANQHGRKSFFDRLFLASERLTTRWLNREADLVFCGTELVARDFHALERDLGLTPRPTTQIGYGIDLAPFRELEMENVGKSHDLVLLGRMHELKGIFELPQVWQGVLKERPGAKLVVIGEGPHRPRLEALFREQGMQHSARFTGGIGEAEKNRLVAGSKVGLSLSYEEGWGLSINEFLAAGLPVVAYDLPIFAQVFPGQLDLVPMHDASAAAKRIVRLLEDESLRREKAQRGREFIQRYDFREVAKAELGPLLGLRPKRG